MAKSVSTDDYNHTFYGIVNKQGNLWTPMVFNSERAAVDYMNESIGKSPALASIARTHRVVPVRATIEVIESNAS